MEELELWQKEFLAKIEEKLRSAIRASSQNYISGSSSAVCELIDDATTSIGCFKIRAWPGNPLIDLTYVCDDLKWADTGDTIASFTTDYLSFEQMAMLMYKVIQIYDFGK